jgi:hypothetical protein
MGVCVFRDCCWNYNGSFVVCNEQCSTGWRLEVSRSRIWDDTTAVIMSNTGYSWNSIFNSLLQPF